MGLAAFAAAPARADVLLNEVNCEGTDWIELVNTAAEPADVSGWRLTDDPIEGPGDPFVLPTDTVIPPQGLLAFVRNAPSSFTFGIGCDGEEVIRLGDQTPVLVDEVEVPDPAVGGDTWGRYPDGSAAWQATLPTQGTPNQPATGLGPDLAGWMYDPATVVEIDLDLPPESIEALNADPDEYVPGDFSLTTPEDSYEVLEIGVRLKGGASFQPLGGKAAFKLKFNEFVAGQRFFGLEKLTLNNMLQDPSMLHEVLSYAAFRASGVPAPRAGYAYVRVNEADYGLYLNLETLDRISLPRWFDSTQHLYEGEQGTDVTAGELAAFDVDEGSESDLSDLEALSAAAADTGADFSEQMAPLADLEEMTRMWAVEKYVGQWDGYAGGIYSPALPNNYYLHSDAGGVFRMIPWGLDLTLVDRLSFDGAGAGLLFDRCLADPSCKEMFRDAVREVSGTIAGLDLDGLAASTAALIAPWQALDPRKFYTVEQFQQGVENVRAFLATRPIDVAAWLNPQPPATQPPTGSPSAGGKRCKKAKKKSAATARKCKKKKRR